MQLSQNENYCANPNKVTLCSNHVDFGPNWTRLELLLNLAASIKHRDRPNSKTANTSKEFRKDLEN